MSGTGETFPYKLHKMLKSVCDCDNDSGEKLVAWLPNGNGFLILNEQAFVEKIIPLHFNLTKMRSFTRQLNLWGFTRNSLRSENISEWQHPHFLRNDETQLSLIKRTPVKSRKSKKNLAPTEQIGHNRGNENTVLTQSSSYTLMGGIAGVGSTERTDFHTITVTPKPPATVPNSCPQMQPDSFKNMLHTSDLDNTLVSSQERMTQSDETTADALNIIGGIGVGNDHYVMSDL